MPREQLPLLLGTLDLLILKALSWGPSHGYGISTAVRERTDGELAIEDAALYKALHRLERNGHIDAQWGTSENNRRARFYRLTPKGRKQLRAEVSRWERYGGAVFKLFSARAR